MANRGDKAMLAAADFKVFIYCDAAAHAPRRVAVVNFVRINGEWHDIPASRAEPTGPTGTGRTLVGDTLPAPGWANSPLPEGAVVRSRHELVCRKCKGMVGRAGGRAPVPMRSEKHLPRVLDTLAAAGVSQISLRGLAARL